MYSIPITIKFTIKERSCARDHIEFHQRRSCAKPRWQDLSRLQPATGEQSGILGLASAEDVKAAVLAARAAFPGWAARRASGGRILNRFLRILENRIDELTQIITAENGKVLSDEKGEIRRGMEVVEFATCAPQVLKGEITGNVGTPVDSHSLRQPRGFVAGVTPSTFLRWSRGGCSRSRLLVEIPSFYSHPSAARRHLSFWQNG